MLQPNLIDKLKQALSLPAQQLLDALLGRAKEDRLSLYLVGGAVRDLLLDRPTLDLDITLEGDAPALARRVAEDLPDVRCVVHSAFGTAILKGGDFRLDLTTARAETYERPGALPTVRPDSLRDDLLRRDFTVNAMALALTGDRTGRIIDPFGGKDDLAAKLLRVLHEGSFRDDATRILRGARYEPRLGFRFEAKTLRWLKRDVGFLETISGPRLREELARILSEPQPQRILLRLHDLSALRAIHPALSFDSRRADSFEALREMRRDSSPTAYLALLSWDISQQEAAALSARLALNRRQTEAVRAVPAVGALERELSGPVKPSRTVDLLSPFPLPAVWALAASGGEHTRRQALGYLRRWRSLKPALDGHALLAMGARPGPRLGEVLRCLKAAKLDGDVRSRDDEERMARQLLGLSLESRT